MKVEKTERNFQMLRHPRYTQAQEDMALIQCSSLIGPYPDSLDKPGFSFLWIGKDHHLDRDEVEKLIWHLQHWLLTGKLDSSI